MDAASSISSSDLPVWVLNLAASTARMQHMATQLTRLGVPFERVEAINGHGLDDEAVRQLAGNQALQVQPWLGRRLTGGEIGCALSHAALWERLAAGPHAGALILEDDVDLSPRLPVLLRALGASSGRFDLVFVGHHSSRRPWIPGAPVTHDHGALTTFASEALAPGVRVARTVEYAQGAYAYFLTRDAARRLLRFALPIRMPADTATGYATRVHLRLHALTRPEAVPNAAFATTITEDRPCPCRVCSAARLRARAAGAETPDLTSGFCQADRRRAGALVRNAGGAVLLLGRRLGIRPGSYWAPRLD